MRNKMPIYLNNKQKKLLLKELDMYPSYVQNVIDIVLQTYSFDNTSDQLIKDCSKSKECQKRFFEDLR